MSTSDTMGMIAEILPFSLNDGPGIRTTVFLKGCPLHCPWCHNPETYASAPQLLYSAAACVHCGACAAVCPQKSREMSGAFSSAKVKCTACGACVKACPAQANRLSGERITAGQAAKRILTDKPFFRNKGGATFSGGEPLAQAAFVSACEDVLLASGVQSAVETSLYAEREAVDALLPRTSLFLCDWKISDSALHKRLTGVDNARILENLFYLDNRRARIILRCVIVPGINDTEAHFRCIGRLTYALKQVLQVDLLPYHGIGNDKRKRLGMPSDGFTEPTIAQINVWKESLQSLSRVPVHL